MQRELYDCGKLYKEESLVGDELHSTTGPAGRMWHKNGQLMLVEYRTHGILDNKNGAAVMMYYDNGDPWYTAHFVNGVADNKKGPAFLFWYPKKRLFCAEFYVDGQRLTAKEFYSKCPISKGN